MGVQQCNICGSSDRKEAFGGKTWRVEGIESVLSYVECQQCHSLSLVPEISPSVLSDYYARHYDYETFIAMRSGKEEEARIRAQKIDSLIPFNGTKKALDIGANAGYFMNAIQRCGWHAHGLELSEAMITYAADTFGLAIQKGGIKCLEADTNVYAAVTLWHVFEHLLHPRQVIELISMRLQQGGVFACAIPNIESLAARVMKESWRWLSPPAHLHHVPKQALITLAAEYGLRCVDARTRDNFASNDMLFEYVTSVALRCPDVYPPAIQRELAHISAEEKKDDRLLFDELWQSEDGTYLEHCVVDGMAKKPHRRLRSYTRYLSLVFAPFIKELWRLGFGAELECYFIKK